MSIVTGLSLLDGDVTAAGLSPEQLQFLRDWKLRNGDASQLRVVWEPATVRGTKPSPSRDTAKIPNWLRREIVSNRHGVLKAGYPPPPEMADSPAPSPRIIVVSAPAPSMPQPAKPSQPPPMPSYGPPQQHQPMPPPMMSYPPAQSSAPDPHGSSMPMPEAPTSYRVIHIQKPPPEQPQPAMKPQPQPSYPSHDPAPAPPAPMGYPPPPSMPAAAMPKPQTPTAVQSSYSVSQTQAEQGGSYRIIYIQPPSEQADPPAMKPAPSPYPSHEPAPQPPQMMGYPPPAAPEPEPASAEPQTLLVVVPSQMTSSSTEKSAAPAIPACSPAPGNDYSQVAV